MKMRVSIAGGQGDVGWRMAKALEGTIAEVGALTSKAGTNGNSYLNLAVSDGTRAVVPRYATGNAESPSLCTSTGKQCVREDGVCRMIQGGDRRSTVIVASEPLHDGPEWERVPDNHRLLIHPAVQFGDAASVDSPWT